MNIWIEGIDGSGKTTLAAALAKKLEVEPLWNLAHAELPAGGWHNVIDRNRYITNRVYKAALPKRFKEREDIPPSEFRSTRDDLFVFIDTKTPIDRNSVQDYDLKELEQIYYKYCVFFSSQIRRGMRMLNVKRDGKDLAVEDLATMPGLMIGAWMPIPGSVSTKDNQIEFIAKTIADYIQLQAGFDSDMQRVSYF